MTPKIVLICDSDRTMQRILQHLLEKEGFTVNSFSTGKTGPARIRAAKPHLLVLNFKMPAKEGPKILQELEKSAGQKPYIIVLSHHENPAKHQETLSFGADEVIIKPFQPSDFTKKIKSLVKGGRI